MEAIVAVYLRPRHMPAHRPPRPRARPARRRRRRRSPPRPVPADRARRRARAGRARAVVGAARAGGRRVIPRLVIAGTSSGAGKTTVATGLMAALRRPRRARRPAPRSAPTSSIPATTRSPAGGPGRNLDAFLSRPGADRAAVPPRRRGRRGRRRRGRDGPLRRRLRPRRAGLAPRTWPSCCARPSCSSSTPLRWRARSRRSSTATRRSTPTSTSPA